MKLGVLKRISKGDLQKAGGEIPRWLDAMLSPLNTFIEKVGITLQGKLTFDDNFLCKVTYLEFTHGVEQLINPKISSAPNARVVGVIYVSAGGLTVDKFKWVQKETGNIGVTFSFDGGTAATKAWCRLYILLGGD